MKNFLKIDFFTSKLTLILAKSFGRCLKAIPWLLVLKRKGNKARERISFAKCLYVSACRGFGLFPVHTNRESSQIL